MCEKSVSICLNMIVKNESKIIIRLLTSVLPIIDTYVICDTGSTDNTPDIITNFFNSHNIKGEIIYEPFKNFGYNRTFALRSARGKATYALLLDADMIFRIESSFKKEELNKSGYLIIQKGGNLSYHNIRLIRLDIDAKCLGPTHEYYDLPPGSQTEKLDSLWIDDIGDGGCKGDKFERDIKLLKDGIEEEPNNGRYYFYLGNSYFNTGRHKESIEYYKKRIELGGWCEEVFYSHLNLGHAYMSINSPELAIFTWLAGYNLHSQRAETIYEITKYYREKGMNKIAMSFCLLGKSIPYPKNDTLFIHNDVYDTGFDYELSIIGYYNNYQNLHKISYKLMNKLPSKWENILSNYKFYCPRLSNFIINKIGGVSINKNINVCGTIYPMNGSNPCIFKIKNDYMVNIRYVNYNLQQNGSYLFPIDDNRIVTVNCIYNITELINNTISNAMNNTLEKLIMKGGYIMIPDKNNLRYVGIEDLKPYINNNENNENNKNNIIKFMGTIQNSRSNNISIGYGNLNINLHSLINNEENNLDYNLDLNYSAVETKWNKTCEKNWVFYGDEKIIYSWYPLIIGNIIERDIPNLDNDNNNNNNNNKNSKELYLEIKEEKKMPDFFRHVRGSTNGYEYDNEIWFLCHVVEYCQPREYYHLFAVFEKNTMNIKKWSNLFKFEGEKIEYSLGLIVEKDKIIISYSKWDREPTICIYNKFKIEIEMF